MENATSSDPWAREKQAWWKLTKQEQDVIVQYNHNVREDFFDKILLLEVLRIQERHPDLCPILSVPERFLCS